MSNRGPSELTDHSVAMGDELLVLIRLGPGAGFPVLMQRK